jgi:hypothetical protein
MKDRLWLADMHLVITDVKTDSVKPFENGNIGSNWTSMNQLTGSDADEAFWENYNILKPVPDSLRQISAIDPSQENKPVENKSTMQVSNRQNGFTRADTLRGKLSPLRSCYDVTFYHLDVAVDMDKHSI